MSIISHSKRPMLHHINEWIKPQFGECTMRLYFIKINSAL